MTERDLNPYVRYVQKRTAPLPYPHPVCAFDFRMFYVKLGRIDVIMPDTQVSLHAGGLITIPPATEYRLAFYGGELIYYVINFDFISSVCGDTPRSPVKADDFLREEVFSDECPPEFAPPLHTMDAAMLEPSIAEIDRARQAGSAHIASAMMKYTIGKILLMRSGHTRSTSEDELIKKVKEYVNTSFSLAITNATVAQKMGYHPNYLGSRFLAAEGMTLHAYIEGIRIKRAKELLTSSQEPIYAVAEACGFSEPSYFVKFFVRNVGMTPKEYRKLSM